MFRTTFFFEEDLCSREEIGMLMFLPENWKNMVFEHSYSSFFFEEAVHSRKDVLLLIVQVRSFPMSFLMIVFITPSGSPM